MNGTSWDSTPDFFPLSRFRAQYYRPDIVQRVLTTMDETLAVSEANRSVSAATADNQPEKHGNTRDIREILPAVAEFAEDTFEFETDRTDIKLRYRLRSPSGRPITRVEIEIDGRPVSLSTPD